MGYIDAKNNNATSYAIVRTSVRVCVRVCVCMSIKSIRMIARSFVWWLYFRRIFVDISFHKPLKLPVQDNEFDPNGKG